jgi:hypothetical protein
MSLRRFRRAVERALRRPTKREMRRLEGVANDAQARFTALHAMIPEFNQKFSAPDSVQNLVVNIRSLSTNLAEQVDVLTQWADAIEDARKLAEQ